MLTTESEKEPGMHTTATKIGWAITAALAVPGLVMAAPAAARPSPDFPQTPAQSCSEANVSGGTASYIPVPGDPAAYQKCGPAGPVGIKHCQTGSAFDSSTGYCVATQGSGATLSVDAVWQEGDSSDCQAACPPRPIKVKLTYSGTSVGMASVTLSTRPRRASPGAAQRAHSPATAQPIRSSSPPTNWYPPPQTGHSGPAPRWPCRDTSPTAKPTPTATRPSRWQP